jgi:hypothetical protein
MVSVIVRRVDKQRLKYFNTVFFVHIRSDNFY